MGQYASWTFEQLFAEKNGCIQANHELRSQLHQLDWSDREGRDDINRALERNERTIAAVEAEIEERRARPGSGSHADFTVPASSHPESADAVSSLARGSTAPASLRFMPV